MYLYDLFDTRLLYDMIDQGFVRSKNHPTLPLRIYNYTEQAQFKRVWNDVTLNCRGLIVHDETEEVLARPFEKFFNFGEDGNREFDGMGGPVEVTDKLDGSLGILYPVPDGGYAIATRGSFVSDQAVHATELLHSKYPDFQPVGDRTYLFEIVYPENRIVCDYGDTDDLILLGTVSLTTGLTLGPRISLGWTGPRAEVLPFKDFRDALTAPPRPGKEGMVVRWPWTDFRLKLKQQDYVELHRIVTGLNERSIWDRLREGRDVFEGIPDELHDWVNEVASPMMADHQNMAFSAREAFIGVEAILRSRGWREASNLNRKEFAVVVNQLFGVKPWLKTCLFLMLDDKSINDFLWKQVRPAGETKRAKPGREDVA